MTPIKVSNETTESFIAPNIQNPIKITTLTKDMSDNIVVSLVLI